MERGRGEEMPESDSSVLFTLVPAVLEVTPRETFNTSAVLFLQEDVHWRKNSPSDEPQK